MSLSFRSPFFMLPLLGFLLTAGSSGSARAELVAHYTFDNAENPGLDSAGGDDNATQNGGAIFSTGAVAGTGALLLDGATPGFTITPGTEVDGDFSADRNFTVSAWFRVDRAAGRQRIFSSGGGWGLGVDFGSGTQLLMTAYGVIDNLFPVDFVTGKWHHVAVTVSPADENEESTTIIYLDGVQIGDALNAYNPVVNPMLIGSGGGTHEAFRGALDELSYYDNALTAAEVQTLYASVAIDTDGDTMLDSWESAYGLNPISNADAQTDLDQDGLTNVQEYNLGLLPNNDDFDSDGYKDGVENNTGEYASETQTGTDPKNPDSDGDGILDGAEMATGPGDAYATDPTKFDTDDDGLPDGYETLIANSDPTSAASPVYPDDGLVARYGFDYAPLPGLDSVRGDDNGQLISGTRVTEGTLLGGGAYRSAPFLAGEQINENRQAFNISSGGEDPDFSAMENFSISAWFKVNTATGRHRILTNLGNSPGWGFGVDFSDAGAQILMTTYGVQDKFFPAAEIVAGRWFHAAAVVTLDAGGANAVTRVYLNGELLQMTGTETGLYASNSGLTIGANGSEAWDGMLDEIRYYNVPLTEEAVHALYNQGNSDEDNDGLPAFWELQYGLNPNDPADAALDLDEDGVSNLMEYTLGLLPNDKDTDKDGLEDGVEDGGGVYESASKTGAHPSKPDTDGDGLLDGVENNSGIFMSATETGTNPNLFDTDGDGIPDGYEVNTLNSNPNDAADPVRPPGLIAHYTFDDPANPGADSAGGDDRASRSSDTIIILEEDEAKIGSGALLLDGEQYLTIGTGTYTADAELVETTRFSTAVWFNFEEAAERQRILSSNPGWGLAVNYMEGTPPGILITGYGVLDGYYGGNLTPGQWHHVAFTVSPNERNLPLVTAYLDGVELGAQEFPEAIRAVGNLGIGTQSGGGTFEGFRGKLDDLRYYNKTLTAAEVTELYAMGGTTPPPSGDFLVTGVSRANGLVSLTFSSAAGVTYTVQRSDMLSGWQNVGTVTAAGASTTWTETAAAPASPNNRWFYRVAAPTP